MTSKVKVVFLKKVFWLNCLYYEKKKKVTWFHEILNPKKSFFARCQNVPTTEPFF